MTLLRRRPLLGRFMTVTDALALAQRLRETTRPSTDPDYEWWPNTWGQAFGDELETRGLSVRPLVDLALRAAFGSGLTPEAFQKAVATYNERDDTFRNSIRLWCERAGDSSSALDDQERAALAGLEVEGWPVTEHVASVVRLGCERASQRRQVLGTLCDALESDPSLDDETLAGTCEHFFPSDLVAEDRDAEHAEADVEYIDDLVREARRRVSDASERARKRRTDDGQK